MAGEKDIFGGRRGKMEDGLCGDIILFSYPNCNTSPEVIALPIDRGILLPPPPLK